MKTLWRDGEHIREVETTSLGAGRWKVRVDAAAIDLSVEAMPDGKLRLAGDHGVNVAEVTPVGSQRFVRLGTLDFVLEREVEGRRRDASRAQAGGLEAPMPGVITKVMVVVGDDVTKGQPLLALEAMKMEHMIRAPRAGRVKSVSASPGQMVQAGATLVELADGAG